MTACNEHLAKSIAKKTELFDGIYGSSESIDLRRKKKRHFANPLLELEILTT